MVIVSEKDLRDMTEWKIEEPKRNKKDVARGCQSRMKFMFHVLKGHLAFDVS
jgi:hypothetical protein